MKGGKGLQKAVKRVASVTSIEREESKKTKQVLDILPSPTLRHMQPTQMRPLPRPPITHPFVTPSFNMFMAGASFPRASALPKTPRAVGPILRHVDVLDQPGRDVSGRSFGSAAGQPVIQYFVKDRKRYAIVSFDGSPTTTFTNAKIEPDDTNMYLRQNTGRT